MRSGGAVIQRGAAALATLLVALAVLAPLASVLPEHDDEAQYLWTAAYYGRRAARLDLLSQGTDPYVNPGWSPLAYWTMTQPMGARLVYAVTMGVAGLDDVPDYAYWLAKGPPTELDGQMPVRTLVTARLVAAVCGAVGLALLALRWGWVGAGAAALLLMVPHIRSDLPRAWAEGPLLLGLGVAAVAYRTRWFAVACGLALTFKLTALVLWPVVFVKAPLGRSRRRHLLGLAPAALVWTALTPPSWAFGGPVYIIVMVVQRFREQAHHSELFGGPMGQFFPTRYALPFEVGLALVVAWACAALGRAGWGALKGSRQAATVTAGMADPAERMAI
jgi:hypothetical protein